jgi:hypothetical protein
VARIVDPRTRREAGFVHQAKFPNRPESDRRPTAAAPNTAARTGIDPSG